MLHPLHLICVYWWFACHSGQEIHFVCLQLSKCFQARFAEMQRPCSQSPRVKGARYCATGTRIASFSHLKRPN